MQLPPNIKSVFGPELYSTFLDSLFEGVYVLDTNRKIVFWNKGAEKITGYSAEDVTGKPCSENVLMHIDGNGKRLCLEMCPAGKTIANGQFCEGDLFLHHKKGHRIPISVRVIPIQDPEGQTVGAIETFKDNSVNFEIQHLQKMALLDSLTQIPNRRYLEATINARLDESRRYGWQIGLLFIDIDNFKKVNDTHGHDIGDKVLKMTAKTLSTNLRPFDIVGRWGGEEFVVIIININKDELKQLAERFRILVEKSGFFIDSGELSVTISVGAALAASDDNAESLVKKADSLMYQSKSAGRNCVTA